MLVFDEIKILVYEAYDSMMIAYDTFDWKMLTHDEAFSMIAYDGQL